jgi:hypothetical protein
MELYLWGYKKDAVFTPLFPVHILDLNDRHTEAVVAVTKNEVMVWEEPCDTLGACKVRRKTEFLCQSNRVT